MITSYIVSPAVCRSGIISSVSHFVVCEICRHVIESRQWYINLKFVSSVTVSHNVVQNVLLFILIRYLNEMSKTLKVQLSIVP